ncbi:MAG: LysR family transcriptional regulator [Ruminococcaceae bacterium]|nr:LysR family transcriptional regulator [Oscillospiraceae bacterium]
MDIRVLRYFLTVVREENISRAAEILFITQPTLSRQLQELEKELNTKLFIRGKSKITLTESGMLLRRRAEELIELADKTEREFLFKEENISGTISVGCGETMAVKALSEFIAAFSKEYPEVRFEIYTGASDHIKEEIDRGLLDVGLLMEPIEIEKYEYIRLKQTERWGVVLRSDNPLCEKNAISVGDILDVPLILPRRLGTQGVLRNWFGEDFNHLRIIATGNLIANSARLVMQGLGSAVTIEGAVDLYQNQQLCFRPLVPKLENNSVLVWKKYQPFGQAASKFIELSKYALKA